MPRRKRIRRSRYDRFAKPRYSSHLGHKVRSMLEENMYTTLKQLGISYIREPPIGYTDGIYRPDAVIGEDVILEAKGVFTQTAIKKMIQFKKDWGEDFEIILVVYGNQLGRYLGWKKYFASD